MGQDEQGVFTAMGKGTSGEEKEEARFGQVHKGSGKRVGKKGVRGGERKSHGGYLESIKEKNLTEMATRAYEIAGKEDHQRRWWFERHGSGMTKSGRDRRFS